MIKLFRNGWAYFRGLIFKIFHCGIVGNKFRYFSGASIRLYRGSNAKIGNHVKIDNHAVIAVQGQGVLEIGNDVGIGINNMIVCHKSLRIQDGTILGPGVNIYDHDHLYSQKNGVDSKTYKYADVNIGKNCWIGANTVILRGTTIGDNSVIGAGCVLKGEYPAGAIIIQKGKQRLLKMRGNSGKKI